ncbi:MAG: OB-fold putative lipoprotein [Candidatus Moranbacteria bacterium]|nr:OB-fold putative lipoprotein [Candidatus Moranbacteria bacterium]
MDQNPQSTGETQNTPQKKAWYKRWWVILIGIFIIFGAIGSNGDNKSASPSKETPSEQKEEKVAEKAPDPEQPKAPEVTVTSAVLAKDYKENEVSADVKYKGKLIELSGKVASVDNGTFDNEIIVRLTDGQYDFSGPMCYMKPSEHDKVVDFKKGQAVTLIGEGNSATIGSPMLKSCVIK